MISPMTKYSFILLNGEQEGLLEKLQEIGLVDITRSVKPVDGPSGELLRGVEQRKELVQSLGKIFFPEELKAEPVEGDLVYATAAALDTLEELGERMKALEKEAATSPMVKGSTTESPLCSTKSGNSASPIATG